MQDLSHEEILKTDLFSVGAILYQLLTGKPLIKGESVQDLIENSKEFIFNLEHVDIKNIESNISKECLKFLSKLLKNPLKDRPSSSECLHDPWFTQSYNMCLQPNRHLDVAKPPLKAFTFGQNSQLSKVSNNLI